MELTDIRDALLTTGVPVFHYKAETKAKKYIVWAEEGDSNSNHADNMPSTIILEGTVDYFTKEEYDSKKALLESSLRNIGCAVKLNSIQYEDDTKYIHYEWVWQVRTSG